MGATEELNFNFYLMLMNLNVNSHMWLVAAVVDKISIHFHPFPVWSKPVSFRCASLTRILNAVMFALCLPINLGFKNKNSDTGSGTHRSWHVPSSGSAPCAVLRNYTPCLISSLMMTAWVYR